MRKIIILLLAACFGLLSFTKPTAITITGRVTDAQGSPIPGASITIKGKKGGVTTDMYGNFSINVEDTRAVLIVAAVGYNSKNVTVGKHTTLNITLEISTQSLDEVVVVGYGGEKDYTASWQRPALAPKKVGIDQHLQGRASGLMVTSSGSFYTPSSGNGTPGNGYSREGYDNITENSFLKVKDNPLSTFSIDVDAASYSNVRRMLNDGQLPPAGAVRTEEMINYFSYEYPQPTDGRPFSVNTEIAECPWNKQHRIALIGLQGRTIPAENLPPANVVFLIDVSGSMQSEDKLPLVKQSLKLLADQLREQDKVSICVYAGNAGLVLPATNGLDKQRIKTAIDALEAGGSTAGGEGIQLAYKTAKDNFIKDGNNRVVLCTDGDFNVGISSDDELERLIETERKSGVFLTVLGYGTGNYQDAKMQKLADKGNGNHAYIDQLSEARKVLVNEFGGTLFTIAKDVKLQIEFNPAKVQGYRLIGYENRMLAKEDFNDDRKDAGEMGSGHTVTALYEIIPVGIKTDLLKKTDVLKYQEEEGFSRAAASDEMMTVKLRYKLPGADASLLLDQPVKDGAKPITLASDNFRFASAVAAFGMVLRQSAYKQGATFKTVIDLARSALQYDRGGYRKEFVSLVEQASALAKKDKKFNRKKVFTEEEEEDEEASSR